jgi:hypothetical protein
MNIIRRALGRIRTGHPIGSPRPRDDEGFGLLECIVAMVALLVVLIPTSYVFTNVLSQAASARQRITALSVAEQWIETLNNQGPPSDTNNQPEVGTAISEPSSVLSGITYKVSAEFNWTDATGGTPDFCSSDTSPVLGLQVTVSWVGGQTITDQAILNFPASGNLTNGYLAIQVNGDPASGPPNDVFSSPWSTRVQTVPVQVSGSNLTTPYSLKPGSDGCVFLQLAPGTYSVQVGPNSSGSTAYVANYNESSSETQALSTQSAITVVNAEITQVVFQYDEGANVGVAYPTTTSTDDGIACPNTSSLICLAMGQTATSATAPSVSPVADGIAKTSSGWSVASFPSSMTRIEDLGCTTSACIAVGYSSSGGAAAVSTNGTTWTNSTLPSGVSALTSIVCPTGATTPACIAIGSGTSSNGVLLTATISGSTVTWTKDTTPTVTALTQIVCPSTTAQPVCFVVGTASSTTATIISNTGSAAPGTSWTAYSGVTMAALTQLVCNSTTACWAIGKTSSAPSIISTANGTSWTAYTASGFTPTAFNSIACGTSGSHCWASGTASSGPILVYLSSGTTWSADTGVPSTATTVNSVTCPGTTSGCFALYSTTTSAGVLSITSGTAWATPTFPTGVVSLSELVCPSTTACYAVGTSSSSAVIDVLKSGTWSSATFTGTTGGNPVYISQLLCYAATSCEAAGATETAAQVLDYNNTSVSFSGSGTPNVLIPNYLPVASDLTGMFLDNPPIMVSNANLQPNTTIEMSAPTTANGPQTQVGPLFPFASGYSIAVGYCASELTTASGSASTTPGATPSTSPVAPTVILPMGILPIEATTSAGVPISGATISIVDTTCSSSSSPAELTPLSSGSYPALSSPPSSPSNPTSYAMPTTGVDGLSRIDVIYGTYAVTVTSGSTHATTTVTVNPTSIVVGSTTYYMPAFVPIPD